MIGIAETEMERCNLFLCSCAFARDGKPPAWCGVSDLVSVFQVEYRRQPTFVTRDAFYRR